MSENTDANTLGMSEDELIDAALAALDQTPLPSGAVAGQPSAPNRPAAEGESDTLPETAEGGALGAPPEMQHSSPTLEALDASRRPQVATACEHCPNSVWFASPKEVKCYCRVMYLITWTSDKPGEILLCDGTALG